MIFTRHVGMYLSLLLLITITLACPPGLTLNEDASGCINCKAGYYKESFEEVFCTQCPLGTITVTEGSTSKKECLSILEESNCHQSFCLNGGQLVRENRFCMCNCTSGYSGMRCQYGLREKEEGALKIYVKGKPMKLFKLIVVILATLLGLFIVLAPIIFVVARKRRCCGRDVCFSENRSSDTDKINGCCCCYGYDSSSDESSDCESSYSTSKDNKDEKTRRQDKDDKLRRHKDTQKVTQHSSSTKKSHSHLDPLTKSHIRCDKSKEHSPLCRKNDSGRISVRHGNIPHTHKLVLKVLKPTLTKIDNSRTIFKDKTIGPDVMLYNTSEK